MKKDIDLFDESGKSEGAGAPEEKASDQKVSEKKNVAVWQFKFKEYHYILPVLDKEARKMPSGLLPNKVLRVHNWLVELDLGNAEDRKIDEFLKGSERRGLDFWPVVEKAEGDTVLDRAATLNELMGLGIPQLQAMMSAEEFAAVGILSSSATKADLIMAIMDRKRISKKG